MDLHPFLWMISNIIQQEHKPAIPMDMDESMVNASGGLYDNSGASMLEFLLRECPDYSGERTARKSLSALEKRY